MLHFLEDSPGEWLKETRGRKLSRRKKGARGRGTTRNKESKKVEGRKKTGR